MELLVKMVKKRDPVCQRYPADLAHSDNQIKHVNMDEGKKLILDYSENEEEKNGISC